MFFCNSVIDASSACCQPDVAACTIARALRCQLTIFNSSSAEMRGGVVLCASSTASRTRSRFLMTCVPYHACTASVEMFGGGLRLGPHPTRVSETIAATSAEMNSFMLARLLSVNEEIEHGH